MIVRFCIALVLVVLGLGGTGPSCAQKKENVPDAFGDEPEPYDLTRPDAVHELPRRLDEISGLTALEDGRLAAVNDEDGDLFFIDSSTGEVLKRTAFDKDRDYEGIERVGDTLYVLESDGDLYRITGWDTDEPDVERIETPLSARYDTEGLAYDEEQHRLLVVCKEYAGKDLDRYKAIYAFDLSENQLISEPVRLIDTRILAAQRDDDRLNKRIRAFLSQWSDFSGFKPSAFAIHPVTGDWYVISSVGKLLIVLSEDGHLVQVWTLSERLFRQPEGLAFLPNGDLFIANEAAGDRATLLRFSYRGGTR